MTADRWCGMSPELQQRCARLELPVFIYDVARISDTLEAYVKHFEHPQFPVKCNPHRRVLQAVLDAGMGVDVCSEEELELAREIGFPIEHVSYTSPALTTNRLRRLVDAGCRIHLDSLDQVRWWAENVPTQSCAIRLQVSDGGSYGSGSQKFGIQGGHLSEVGRILSDSDNTVRGVHVHTGHRQRSVDGFAHWASRQIQSLPARWISQLEWINLGGGWPYAYAGETRWRFGDVSACLQREVLTPLARAGFSGQVEVEPGEVLVADAGWLLAEVAAVKTHGVGKRVIVLDSAVPVPATPFAYRGLLLRRHADSLEPVPGQSEGECDVFGASNNGHDLIRSGLELPRAHPGDVMLLGDMGAYVENLISHFNSRTPPGTVFYESERA